MLEVKEVRVYCTWSLRKNMLNQWTTTVEDGFEEMGKGNVLIKFREEHTGWLTTASTKENS